MIMHYQSFLLTIILVEGAFNSPIFEKLYCSSDVDCPKNFFCYDETNICAECREDFCFRLNRQNSFRQCHRHYSDCEDCLPGYEEEIFADGKPREACILSSHSPPQQIAAEIESPGLSSQKTTVLVGSAIFISLVAVLGLVTFIRTRNSYREVIRALRQNSVSEDRVQEEEQSCRQENTESLPMLNNPEIRDPPPPYPERIREDEQSCQQENTESLTMLNDPEIKKCPPPISPAFLSSIFPPTAPSLGDKETSFYEVNKIEDNLVQAVPFRAANCSDDEDASNSEEEVEHLEDAVEGNIVNNVNYHDENTQPSSWTPGTSPNNVENSTSLRPALKRTLEEEDSGDERPFKQLSRLDEDFQ